jgi:hypothetical protein
MIAQKLFRKFVYIIIYKNANIRHNITNYNIFRHKLLKAL